MPISRNKRKKPKSKTKPVRQSPGAMKEKPSKEAKPQAAVVKEPPPKPKKEKLSLYQMLYQDDAEGLMRVVRFSPLITGAWLAGGFILSDVLVFAVLTAALILAYYTAPLSKRDDVIFIKDFKYVLYLVQAGLLWVFYSLSQQWLMGVIAVLASLLVLGSGFLSLKTPASVILSMCSLVGQMSLFAVLGIFSQIHDKKPEMLVQYAVLGFVPGMVLAAALAARHSKVFLDAAWQRSFSKQSKDGKELLRPGGLSRLYSMFIVLGPALPVALAPLGLFPWPFMACGLGYIFIPQTAENFLEEKQSDAQTAVRSTNIAAAMSLLVFLAAMAAKYNL
jgi:hypothetical protein